MNTIEATLRDFMVFKDFVSINMQREKQSLDFNDERQERIKDYTTTRLVQARYPRRQKKERK